MPAKRKRLQRLPRVTLTPEVVQTFKEIQRLEKRCVCYDKAPRCDACTKWWKLMASLRVPLHTPSNFWPILPPPDGGRDGCGLVRGARSGTGTVNVLMADAQAGISALSLAARGAPRFSSGSAESSLPAPLVVKPHLGRVKAAGQKRFGYCAPCPQKWT
jgi:hypothetical protein